MSKEDLLNTSPFPEERQRSSSESSREAEERHFKELQQKLRHESQEQLGYDVFESRCPHCGEKFALTIEDPGKEIPKNLRWLTILVPRLRNTEATLRCVSCGKSFKTPSLLAELTIPLVLLAVVLALVMADFVLITYLCNY